MRHIESLLFTEKYRPKTIDDMILPERFKKRFENGLGDLNRILLYSSSPGTGKSSLAKVLVEQFKHPYLYINTSRESSVDILREDINDFCSLQSVQTLHKKNTKVVILDEIDGASQQFFKALRASMDQFKHVGFIATCNYYSKIPESIRSRFDNIDFTFTEKDQKDLKYKYSEQLLKICKNENLKIDAKALSALVKKYFPDMRSMLNLLQSLKSENITNITEEHIKNTSVVFGDLFSLPFQKDIPIIYKTIMEKYSANIETVLSAFFNEFPLFLQKQYPQYYETHLAKTIITIAKYQSMKNQVIDLPLVAIAMIYELQQIFN